MSSPGIDKWIEDAPKSWAKLANTKNKKTSFNNWKKKFFEGTEQENKDYLKKYITNEQLKHIYEKGYGGKIKTSTSPIQPPTKPTKITIKRNNKEYTKSVTPHWSTQTKFILTLAAKTKPRSTEYKKYVDIIISTGRTRQAVTKKIQRTRRKSK